MAITRANLARLLGELVPYKQKPSEGTIRLEEPRYNLLPADSVLIERALAVTPRIHGDDHRKVATTHANLAWSFKHALASALKTLLALKKTFIVVCIGGLFGPLFRRTSAADDLVSDRIHERSVGDLVEGAIDAGDERLGPAVLHSS